MRPDRGRRSRLSELGLYGRTTGNKTPEGFPERIYDWVEGWTDPQQLVVFGHDVVGFEPRWMSESVVRIDTGC